jgi:hypothetical protein
MNTAMFVVLVLLIIAFLVAGAVLNHKPKGKAIDFDYDYRPSTTRSSSGKCNNSRCRRTSRQRPYNGAWRQR